MIQADRLIVFFILCSAVVDLVAAADGGPVSFVSDVRPVLSDKCFACHGPDASTREADLRLDDLQSVLDAGSIVPGEPDESELMRRMLSEDPDQQMPPPAAHKELTEEEIEIIRRWIQQGARYEQHWSYRPLIRPAVPTINRNRVGNPIDAFILQQLTNENHDLSPAADKTTLIRRLYFDLLGVPPSDDEVQSFLADESVDARQRLIDRLLRDQRYGERMAVHWLDLVRYADTIGYHSDSHREVSAYRDYVIDAFNQNMPFDQFTIEQLAGDLLPNPTLSQRIASGYNRLLQTTGEGGAQAKEYIAIYAADRVRNVSAVWMGQTVGCAQCHDHKYDPITSKDFYSLAAFFADVTEIPVGLQPPNLMLPDPDQQQRIERLEAAIADLKATAETDSPTADQAQQQLKQTEQELDELRKSVRTTLITEALAEPRVTRVLARGNWLDEGGEIVEPSVPEFLPHQTITDRRANRLDLASWLVADDNPLTARTFVNRLWKLFFGHGLSRNLDDLGGQGEVPTHPELLDWLAVEFRDSGWDVQGLIRLMLNSETYAQVSTVSDQQRATDPKNRRFGRQSRWRVEAEFVRDTALSLSGLLADQQLGGQSVKPYQPAGYWQHLNFPPREWEADEGEKLYRRSLYTFWCRTFPHPSLIAFDAPSREECTAERPRSNIPQQALVLLNDPIFVEAARVFAARIIDSGQSTEQRLRWAIREALSRPPQEAEVALLQQLYQDQKTQYSQSSELARQLLSVGKSPLPNEVDPVELAAWTQVGRAIINFYETTARY
jgi:hypothetical protein